MFRLHEITGDEQLLQRYVERYERAGGFPLDLAYARRCRAYAFMDGAGAMAGGLLLNGSAPFRSLNDMPEEARRDVEARLDLSQTFEPMCFWVAKEVRGTLSMMLFWAAALFVMWRFPKKDLLACTVHRSLLSLYKGVPTLQVLYQGTIPTSKRVLDKFVILCPGKRGLLRGLAYETSRRALRWATARLLPGAPPSVKAA